MDATAPLDALVLRRRLAVELAAWRRSGFVASARALRFRRQVRVLAGLARVPQAQVMADLEADAAAILEAGEPPPGEAPP